jgi:opacity protein-like surface antigen
MQKLTFVSAWVLALGGAGIVHAADMAVPLPAPPTWAGIYAGATAGGAWGSLDPQTTAINNTYFGPAADVAAVNATGMQSITPSSFTGGLEAGYNWQWGGLVGGLEVDLESLRLAGTAIKSRDLPHFAFPTIRADDEHQQQLAFHRASAPRLRGEQLVVLRRRWSRCDRAERRLHV